MKNYKSQSFLLMFFVVSALVIIGCAKSESTTNRDASAPSSAPATSPATTATSRAGEVGVPECDAFLKAYETCVHDKVPAAARPTFDAQIANWKKLWHDQAANPQSKAALASACKNSHDQAKNTMKAYGCTF
jgi:hypothetical protein